MTVLVQEKRDACGRLTGYTPSYMPVRFHGPDMWRKELINMELKQVHKISDDVLIVEGEVVA